MVCLSPGLPLLRSLCLGCLEKGLGFGFHVDRCFLLEKWRTPAIDTICNSLEVMVLVPLVPMPPPTPQTRRPKWSLQGEPVFLER